MGPVFVKRQPARGILRADEVAVPVCEAIGSSVETMRELARISSSKESAAQGGEG